MEILTLMKVSKRNFYLDEGFYRKSLVSRGLNKNLHAGEYFQVKF